MWPQRYPSAPLAPYVLEMLEDKAKGLQTLYYARHRGEQHEEAS